MASLDGDWFCDEGGIEQLNCFAVWIHDDDDPDGGTYVCGFHDMPPKKHRRDFDDPPKPADVADYGDSPKGAT